jgi:ATP sulfurylase
MEQYLQGMSQENQGLIEPYRGRLVNLMTPNEGREELKRLAASLPQIQLSERAVCDLELLATGGFPRSKPFWDAPTTNV